LIKRNDESLFTRCVWGNGIDSSLPKADKIVFGIDLAKKNLLSVGWEAALPVVGSLLNLEPQLDPIRYRARTFPDASQIAQLRRLAE
jgi:hypothetical protein